MPTALPPRNAIDPRDTWDLSPIFKDPDAWRAANKQLQQLSQSFCDHYLDQLTAPEQIVAALDDLNAIETLRERVDCYAAFPQSADSTNPTPNAHVATNANVQAQVDNALSFLLPALANLPASILATVRKLRPQYDGYIRHLQVAHGHTLAPNVEGALASMAPALDTFRNVRRQAIAGDMDFGTFSAHGQSHPLDFVSYEETYQKHPDTDIRRAAFTKFSATLHQYEHAFATAYLGQVTREKAEATLRGYDSVIYFLLADEEVPRALFDRQIDVLMDRLAPVMRRYVQHVADVRGLNHITYTDLQIDIDPDFAPQYRQSDAADIVAHATAVLGDDYQQLMRRAIGDRWVDYAANVGKDSGAYTEMPYGVHPYIMMTWTDTMPALYTLIHELGHVGQMQYSADAHPAINWVMPIYHCEAPSTFNELLLTRYLTEQAHDDARLQRFALSRLLGDTYFHNCVTHLLEAAFQREVYTLIDKGESFNAERLNQIKLGLLRKFWGDTVDLTGAETTWMRQDHYFLGLYSYSYSASLTIATQAWQALDQDQSSAVTRWREFLALGNSLPPVQAAAVAGVDVTTDAPLQHMVDFLDATERKIEGLTAAINRAEG